MLSSQLAGSPPPTVLWITTLPVSLHTSTPLCPSVLVQATPMPTTTIGFSHQNSIWSHLPITLNIYVLLLSVSPSLLVPTKPLYLDRTFEDPVSFPRASPTLNGSKFTKQDSFLSLLLSSVTQASIAQHPGKASSPLGSHARGCGSPDHSPASHSKPSGCCLHISQSGSASVSAECPGL